MVSGGRFSDVKLHQIEEKSRFDLLHTFAKELESSLGKKIQEGGEGIFESKYMKTTPGYRLIQPILVKYYEDILELSSNSSTGI